MRGNTPEEVMAVVRALERVLPGVRCSGDVRPIEGRLGESRWRVLVQAMVPFELAPDGRARPTQRNAIKAFKQGKRPGQLEEGLI